MAKRLKEDEKNERIIRELLKLPGNRRCVNCNSLPSIFTIEGPRYVCTNFWTFVCTPCSGVHREFTHRVKSVSVAKFTSQEVRAIQEGGNERAKEFYLKEWDPKRQFVPDGSNIERLRDFIRSVYVERRYTIKQSLKPSSITNDGLDSINDERNEEERESRYGFKVVQKNGPYRKYHSQVEVVIPKFGLPLPRAASSNIRGSIINENSEKRKRQIPVSSTIEINVANPEPSKNYFAESKSLYSDTNWATFECSVPESHATSNATTIGSEDFFTAIYSSIPVPVTRQYATQLNGWHYPSVVQPPQVQQRSKSTNPFEDNNESTPVQSQTFPSMASLQRAIPQVSADPTSYNSRIPISTETRQQIQGTNILPLRYEEVGGFSMEGSDFGSLYTSQQPGGGGRLFVYENQSSISTMGGNPFGQV